METDDIDPRQLLAYLNHRFVEHYQRSEWEQARKAIHLAIELANRLRDQAGESWTYEGQNFLAGMYSNRGVLYQNLGDPKAALADFRVAIELREGLRERLGEAWPPGYQNDLAGVYHNRSVLWFEHPDRPDPAAAHADFERADTLMATLPPGQHHEYEHLRFRIAARGARLLDRQGDAETASRWALARSQQLVEVLEMAPLLGTDEAVPWRELFRFYQIFHLHWLRFALEQGRLTELPAILSLLQGRELASRLFEETLADAHETLPEAVRRYLKTRKDLQAVRGQIGRCLNQLGELAGKGGGGSDGTRGGAAGGRGASDFQEEKKAKLKATLARLQAQDSTLRNALARDREAAAAEPGFAALAAPYHPIDTPAVQAQLDEDEAAVLLFSIPADAHDDTPSRYLALVLRARGDLRAIELGRELEQIAERLRQFNGGGRGYREDGLGAGQPVSEAGFWQQVQQALDRQLWQPLAPALEGVGQLSFMTYGDLHLLPFGPDWQARPLWRYPGLVFFQRLRTERPRPLAERARIGVLAHRGDDPARAIPLVEAEAAVAEDLAGAERLADYPEGQAVQPAYDLLHLACHGEERPRRLSR